MTDAPFARLEHHPLHPFISAAVPLHVLEIQRAGGPTDYDYAEVRHFAGELAARGDILQFGGGKKGEAADLANRLARGIAILAWLPGGVTFLGQHFEVATDGNLVTKRQT